MQLVCLLVATVEALDSMVPVRLGWVVAGVQSQFEGAVNSEWLLMVQASGLPLGMMVRLSVKAWLQVWVQAQGPLQRWGYLEEWHQG